MSKETDRMMEELHRFISKQAFESIEDVEKIVGGLAGKRVPSIPNTKLTDAEIAIDLVYKAMEMPLDQGVSLIEEALDVDPDCIAAWEFLADCEESLEISLVFIEKAVSVGRRIFGGDYLEENKGHFWGLHETRPFMRCLQRYAYALYAKEKKAESVAVLEEMIELNPNDNQGVRDLLLAYLIVLGDNEKFEKYDQMFNDDYMAFPLFNRALFNYKTSGDSPRSVEILKKALKRNKFVAAKLISNKRISAVPDYYSPGDDSEAKSYVVFAHEAWQTTNGAIAWLKKHSTKKTK